MAPAFADQTPAWSEGSIRSVRSVAGARGVLSMEAPVGA